VQGTVERNQNLFWRLILALKHSTRKSVADNWLSANQAHKGILWMPWHWEAMKDVIGCEKPRGDANTLWSVDIRMGKPVGACSNMINWIHRFIRRTWGTETSKYPEERTSTETPLVVASERGPGQWPNVKNQNCLERQTEEGESPVWVERHLVLE